jgi:hypothetical protein
MGFFDLFKSEQKDINSTRDQLKLDLNVLLSTSETYESKRKLTKYINKLDRIILSIFDSIIIVINSEEKRIDPNSVVSIVLFKSDKNYTDTQAANVTDTISKICNETNDNWTENDSINIRQENWRGRTFLKLDGCSVFIERSEELGFTLTITNYTNFMTKL